MMPVEFRGGAYRSIKHPILEYIFDQKTNGKTQDLQMNHAFTLQDIGAAMDALFDELHYRPTSYSNFVLDLTRKNTPITSRLPQSLIDLGYDLKKRTGQAANGENYAGVFVYVGVGNAVNTWLVWPTEPTKRLIVQNRLPERVAMYLANDEGALFSVLDYCDVLSHALYATPNTVIRVQNPMKWQPNEIDGLYVTTPQAPVDAITLFLVEAKALSTRDDINLEQMTGAYRTLAQRQPDVQIVPLGIQMTINGLRIAVFDGRHIMSDSDDNLQFQQDILVQFDPPIVAWS